MADDNNTEKDTELDAAAIAEQDPATSEVDASAEESAEETRRQKVKRKRGQSTTFNRKLAKRRSFVVLPERLPKSLMTTTTSMYQR